MRGSEPLRVLNITVKMRRGGGMQNMIMDYYRNINRNKIQFDFLYHVPERQTYDDEIQELGGKVYRVTNYRKSIIRKIIETVKIFREYKENGIIHIHTSSAIRLIDGLLARICGVKTVIFHSHSNFNKKPLKYHLTVPLFRVIGTHFLACSNEAASTFFGEGIIYKSNYFLVKNAIDLKKYKFTSIIREKKRKELNLDPDDIVIGYVGRLSKEKNLQFLYDIFIEVWKLNKHAKLLIVGNGNEEIPLKERAKLDNMDEHVIFTGIRKDIPDLMQLIDAFVMPSFGEGLGIVLIEAQASGTRCYTSKDVVPEEAKVTNLLEFISLEKSAQEWAKIICLKGFCYDREDTFSSIKSCGYEIKDAAKSLEKFYLKVANNYE